MTRLTSAYIAQTQASRFKFRDFAKMGSMATMLSTMPNVTINNITWALTDATKKSLETQSCKLSVENAVAKARDFADTFGIEANAVGAMELTDGRGITAGSAHRNVRMGKAMTVGGLGAGESMLSFESEEIKLQSSITVRFVVESE
jgi:hypothetical protein